MFSVKLAAGLAACLALAAPARADDEIDTGPAMAVAQAWLSLLDAGRYFESWEVLTPAMREALPRAEWDNRMQTGRAPLGRVAGRKVRSANYARARQGAGPEAEYVVIQFNTSFANLPFGIETVTPMREAGGTWKISAYDIR